MLLLYLKIRPYRYNFNKITKCFRESNDVPKRDFVIVLPQNGLMETEFSQHVYCSLTTVS